MVNTASIKRLGIVLLGTVVAAVLAVGLFGVVPAETGLGALEVLFGLLLFVSLVGTTFKIASGAVTEYDVAEVEVDDVITRDGGGGPSPLGPGGVSADDVVDQIERADDDPAAAALIVKLNTPGGAVVPSEDIRKATADFDGPTVAYAEDTAASGGYWIASGADEFHARRASLVGSIGVNGTQLGRTGLAEKAGLEYRRFVAGEYKDTPAQWRELSDDEVEYFQGLLDEWYDQFVDTVAEGRAMEEEFVRDTEARVYSGETAHEMGLVDTCGPREEMEARLADRIGVEEITVEPFEPEQGLTDRVGVGARTVAMAFGAGIASVVGADEVPDIRV
jgi:protease-4